MIMGDEAKVRWKIKKDRDRAERGRKEETGEQQRAGGVGWNFSESGT